MLFLLGMGNAANDNEEPNTFMSLGLATALLINRIRNSVTLLELAKINEEQEEQRQRDTERSRTQKDNADEHARYVDQRLAEFRAFEARFTPNKDLKRVR